MRNDILDRLRFDPGQRTLGQLLQDREAAAHEIERLRSKIEQLAAQGTIRSTNLVTRPISGPPVVDTLGSRPSFRPGSLIRIADVCELLGIGRSTVYKLLSDGAFPKPVRLGPRTVRWRLEAIESWRDNHAR